MQNQVTKQDIQDALDQRESDNAFGVSLIPYHTHNGTDSPRVNPTNLIQFPVVSSAPADTPPIGTIRLYSSGSTYRIYCYLASGWHYAALT